MREATVHNCAIILDADRDFGHVPTLDIQSDENLNQIVMNLNTHNCGSLVYDDVTYDDIDSMSDDNHAGQLYVDNDDVMLDFSDATPPQFQYSKSTFATNDHVNDDIISKIDADKLQYLNETERKELL